jgi:hypothetical protein
MKTHFNRHCAARARLRAASGARNIDTVGEFRTGEVLQHFVPLKNSPAVSISSKGRNDRK